MISNAQTILKLPEVEFVRTIEIYTEMRMLSSEALEWYEAWKEFEGGWFANPDEPRAEIRTGHYMGWLHSRRWRNEKKL